MNILVTGGAGYIGAHVVKLLRDQTDARIHIADNFSQTRRNVLDDPRLIYHEADIRDRQGLDEVFRQAAPAAVFHFAALASVPDSVADPARYYDHNILGTFNLLECMRAHGVGKIVFSSSAAVYGDPRSERVDEEHPKIPTSPYGATKLIGERMLEDYFRAYGIASVSFRYFCAAGADPDLEVGEYHNPQTHVIPAILEAILGQREKFYVFGNDFPTPDGTGVRDYIHVLDLAAAHLAALPKLAGGPIAAQYNLGINQGFSVMELIEAAERVTGQKLAYEIRPRRPGDPAALVADARKAQAELSWQPLYTDIERIIETSYRSLLARSNS